MPEAAGGDSTGGLTLYYLKGRARAEPLRMLLLHAGIRYTDRIVPFAEWARLKPTMPPGKGVPGIASRPPGNRGLPVLELESGERVPETADIAQLIAARAGPPLLPADPAVAAEARAAFDESQRMPLMWVMPMAALYPQAVTEAIMRGEEQITPHGPSSDLPPFSAVVPALRRWEARLGGAAFLGGAAPHYGDFALFHTVDLLYILDPAARGRFSARWHAWEGRMRALPAVRDYIAARPAAGTEGAGSPGSILCEWADPSRRGPPPPGLPETYKAYMRLTNPKGAAAAKL